MPTAPRPATIGPHLHHCLGHRHGGCILGHAAALPSEDGLQGREAAERVGSPVGVVAESVQLCTRAAALAGKDGLQGGREAVRAGQEASSAVHSSCCSRRPAGTAAQGHTAGILAPRGTQLPAVPQLQAPSFPASSCRLST